MAMIKAGDFIVFYENSEFSIVKVDRGRPPREGRKPIIHYREVKTQTVSWWKPWTWVGVSVAKIRSASDFEKTTGAPPFKVDDLGNRFA